MNSRIWRNTIVGVIAAFSVAISADHAVAQKLAKAQKEADQALAVLASAGQVKIESTGTAETIGHVADLKIENLTDQPIKCAVGPMVLESKSRTSQDYVCPKSQTVTIDPRATATVPLDGVCINRNKPPVGKGCTGRSCCEHW